MEIKGVFNSKIEQLFTVFFSSVKISGCRLRIKFDEDPLVVEENNYLTKTVKVSIVYDLDAWPKGPTSNFKFNKGLFGATNIVKNSDKEKYVYSGYGIVQVFRVLKMTLLEMLKFLVLIIVHHLILTIVRITF